MPATRSGGPATATLSSLLSLSLLLPSQAATLPHRLPAFLPAFLPSPNLPSPLRSPLPWARTCPAASRIMTSTAVGGRSTVAPPSLVLDAAGKVGDRLGVPGEALAGSEEGPVAMLELDGLDIPPAATDCWRPTLDDVERISWGKPARKKCTGSRGVPHRLNQDERMLYVMAKRKGFVEFSGSGYRRERSGAPLVNTYRNWCDARGVASVQLYKAVGSGEEGDEVVVDLSTLRIPRSFAHIANQLQTAAPGGVVEIPGMDGGVSTSDGEGLWESSDVSVEEQGVDDSVVAYAGSDGGEEWWGAFEKEPIHRLSFCCVSWVVPRAEAKTLAKRLGAVFGTAEQTGKGKSKGSKAQGGGGAPGVKPGKGRRHGGFGIGGKARKGGYQAREGKPR
mmetsp:Transcript_14809/g.37071  ORF Transcript_14809/g.37071 Transcript_14809/m.37071 type:complete len:392 (-) Transcript_14809:26-1201(-)